MDIGIFGNTADPCVVAIKRAAEKKKVKSSVLDLGKMRKKRFRLMDTTLTVGKERLDWVATTSAWYIRQIPLRVPMARGPKTLEEHNHLVADEPEWAGTMESLIKSLSENALVVNPLETQLLQYQKVHQHHLLSKAGLPVPEWRVMPRDTLAGEIEKHPEEYLGEKWVVKSHASGRGVKTLLPETVRELAENPFAPPPLLQKKIDGTPLRISVVEDEVIGGYAIHTKYLDVREGFLSQEARAEKIDVDEETREITIKALKTLGLFFSEMDFIQTPTRTYILEGNPSPGFAFSETIGIPVAEKLIEHMIENSKR